MRTRSWLRSRVLIPAVAGVGFLFVAGAASFDRAASSSTAGLARTNLSEADAPALGHAPALVGAAARRASSAPFTDRITTRDSLAEGLAAVERYRAQRAVGPLTELATGAADSRLRIRALAALVEVAVEHARPTLRAVAEDAAETDKVRREAARFLARSGSDAEAVLVELLRSDLPARVRGGAVLGLAEIGTTGGAARLYEMATSPTDPMRLESAEALGRVRNPAALDVLAERLSAEGDPVERLLPESVRGALCASLSRARHPEARALLERRLRQDGSPSVRAAAARALGILQSRDAREALLQAREDAESSVTTAVELALSRLPNAPGQPRSR